MMAASKTLFEGTSVWVDVSHTSENSLADT